MSAVDRQILEALDRQVHALHATWIGEEAAALEAAHRARVRVPIRCGRSSAAGRQVMKYALIVVDPGPLPRCQHRLRPRHRRGPVEDAAGVCISMSAHITDTATACNGLATACTFLGALGSLATFGDAEAAAQAAQPPAAGRDAFSGRIA